MASMASSPISRRQFLYRTGVAAAAGAVAAPALGGSPPTDRPNFLFILADDMGWGDLGCYGHPALKTLNLDRLASQGTLFTRYYVAAPSCSPSRASLLTGQYAGRHRIWCALGTPEVNAQRMSADRLEPSVPNVAALLHQAGYVTGHLGKWHLGELVRKRDGGYEGAQPADYGFDEFKDLTSMREPYSNTHSTRVAVDEAVDFVTRHRDGPFYLQLWLKDPHAILDPPDEEMAVYAEYGLGVTLGDRRPNEDLARKYPSAMQVYYAAVTHMDKQIGRLLDTLDELGLSEKTVVVFSTDNGPEDVHIWSAAHSAAGSVGPFRGRKASIYEGGIRVPFVVRYPGRVPAGRVDNETVLSGIDWLPTVCTLADVAPPAEHPLDGQDLSAAWLGRPVERAQPLHWEWRFGFAGDTIHRSPMLAIREGRWKLLMNPDRSRVELYDIPGDPSEVDNRAREHPEVVERLAARVLEWHASMPEGPMPPEAGSNRYPWPGTTG